ncbi:MAG: hypothetical protein RLZZ502_530 [Pseudomonadota bacterium]|jgi:uncharacterized membrane protein
MFMFLTCLINTVFWLPFLWWYGMAPALDWGVLGWTMCLVSSVLHLLYFYFLMFAYRQADLTVVYPVARGLGPVITAVFAVVVFAEPLTVSLGAGLLGVAAGVFLIAGGPSLLRAAQEQARRDRVMKGVRYGALVGCFIASYTLVDAYAVKWLLLSPILLDYLANVARLPIISVLAWPKRSEFKAECKRNFKYAFIVATISPVGYVMVLYAMQLAPMSRVAPARELSMLFAAIVGGHLLGEEDRMLRILGAGAIALGVLVLCW